MPIEEIVTKSYSDNPKLFNQAGQFYNHLHFWKWMKPNGGGRKLPGKLEEQIKRDLGSAPGRGEGPGWGGGRGPKGGLPICSGGGARLDFGRGGPRSTHPVWLLL